MIRVAIVEDDIKYMKQMISYLKRYEAETGEKFRIFQFTDGDEISASYKAEYDIIFMDIQMKLIDGMTAAEIIRKVDSEVIIMFITNMSQYAIRGYAVDALDYVLKPITYFSFSQRLEKAIVKMKKNTSRYIAINSQGNIYKVDISTIYYIETSGRNLIFHTENETYCTMGTIKETEQQLEGTGFFRCNKGYLINLRHVDSYEDKCAVIKGEMIQVSRAKKNGFLLELANYVGGKR